MHLSHTTNAGCDIKVIGSICLGTFWFEQDDLSNFQVSNVLTKNFNEMDGQNIPKISQIKLGMEGGKNRAEIYQISDAKVVLLDLNDA